jgi:hypothetical protein
MLEFTVAACIPCFIYKLEAINPQGADQANPVTWFICLKCKVPANVMKQQLQRPSIKAAVVTTGFLLSGWLRVS